MRTHRLAPGLYQTDRYTIEFIDHNHECAEVAEFVPCWRVDDGRDVIGCYDTKRDALAALEEA